MIPGNDLLSTVPSALASPLAHRIIVGAGGTSQAGWVPYEQSELDITRPEQWNAHFRPNQLEVILAEHVFEHLTAEEAQRAMIAAFRHLKPGGYLRIAVPDGLHPDPNYIEWVRPGGFWNPTTHKQLYTLPTLAAQLEAAGFAVEPYEFWDQAGWFHSRPFREGDGRITRCLWGVYSSLLSAFVGSCYTSLMVDAIKPAAPANGSTRAN